MVGVISNREDMRRHLVPSLAFVHINHFLSVDWQSLVGIHSHTKQSRIGLKWTKTTSISQTVYFCFWSREFNYYGIHLCVHFYILFPWKTQNSYSRGRTFDSNGTTKLHFAKVLMICGDQEVSYCSRCEMFTLTLTREIVELRVIEFPCREIN